MHDIKIEFERNNGELVEPTQHDALQPQNLMGYSRFFNIEAWSAELRIRKIGTDWQAVVNDSQVSTAIRLDLLLTLRVEEGSSLKRALLEDVWHGIILRIGTFFPGQIGAIILGVGSAEQFWERLCRTNSCVD